MDPLTIALLAKGASQLIGAGSDIITGRKDQKEAEANIERLKGEEAELKKARTFGVGDTWNKYLAASKQDKASDLLRQQEQQRFAGNVGALKSGGAKALLGGLAAQSQQSMMQQAQIEAGAQQRQQSALATYAGVEQAAKDANVNLAAQDLARTQGLLDDQEKARIEARNKKREGITAGLTTGADIIGDMAEGEAKEQGLIARYGSKIYAVEGDKVELSRKEARRKRKEGEREQRAKEAEAKSQARATERAEYEANKEPKRTASEKKMDRLKAKEKRYQDRVEYHQEKKKAAPGIYGRRERALDVLNEYRDRERNNRQLAMMGGTRGTGMTDQELIDAINQPSDEGQQASSNASSNAFSGLAGSFAGNSQGISLISDEVMSMFQRPLPRFIPRRKFKDGGVQKTPGEFSHAKNPIDIMKDGAKIGEMTGGEYIFNPRQASTLQSLASKGGSPLHKYVRNLLKEFDKR